MQVARKSAPKVCNVGVATFHGQNSAWAMAGRMTIIAPKTPTTLVCIPKNVLERFRATGLKDGSGIFRCHPSFQIKIKQPTPAAKKYPVQPQTVVPPFVIA